MPASAPGTRWTLRLIALGYLAALLALPVGMIFWRTFEHGVGAGVGRADRPSARCTPCG